MSDKKSESKTVNYSKTTFVNLDSDEGTKKELKKEKLIEPVVGWLVIIGGHGIGKSFELKRGLNEIGRDKGNSIAIAFGDDKINNIRHCIIIFDHSRGKFLIQSGSNDSHILLNEKNLYYFHELSSSDTIKIGSTTMKFISFCSESCTWDFDKLQ